MPTANGTPTGAWTLAKAVTAASRGSVSCQFANIEIAITNSATAPAATFEGHPVAMGHTEPVTMKANDRLWWRLLPNTRAGTSEGAPVGVHTIETI